LDGTIGRVNAEYQSLAGYALVFLSLLPLFDAAANISTFAATAWAIASEIFEAKGH
jgi:hypothetical protein